jgi:hypothetical protein
MGEGNGIEEETQMDNIIENSGKSITPTEDAGQADEVEILPGFPPSITGELVLLDSDNINTGKYFYLL